MGTDKESATFVKKVEAINKDCYRFDLINQSLASHALIERIFIAVIKYSF